MYQYKRSQVINFPQKCCIFVIKIRVIHSFLLCEAAWTQATDGPVDRKDCLNMEKDCKLDRRMTSRQTQYKMVHGGEWRNKGGRQATMLRDSWTADKVSEKLKAKEQEGGRHVMGKSGWTTELNSSDNEMRKWGWWAHGCGWLTVTPSASLKWHTEGSTVNDEAVDTSLDSGTSQDGY